MNIFSPNDGRFIQKSEAKELCQKFRNANPNHVVSQYFGRNKLEEILSQDNLIGIRIYYAQEDHPGQNEPEPHLVIVGVDNNDYDMLDSDNGDQILQFSVPCPPSCPPPESETL